MIVSQVISSDGTAILGAIMPPPATKRYRVLVDFFAPLEAAWQPAPTCATL